MHSAQCSENMWNEKLLFETGISTPESKLLSLLQKTISSFSLPHQTISFFNCLLYDFLLLVLVVNKGLKNI